MGKNFAKTGTNGFIQWIIGGEHTMGVQSPTKFYSAYGFNH